MLTPESLAELRRLMGNVTILRGTPRRGGKTYARETLAAAAVNALPALLDAAADRDALRAERDALLAIIDDARHALSADGPKVEPARQALARALPQITAWQDRTRHARDNTPPHVIAHRGAQLDAVTAERDTLAAKVERVRVWLMSRGVDVSDRDGDYMDGYRAAQRHAVQDAATLLAAIGGDANDEPEPNPDDCPVCDAPRHFDPNAYHPAVLCARCGADHGSTPCPHWNNDDDPRVAVVREWLSVVPLDSDAGDEGLARDLVAKLDAVRAEGMSLDGADLMTAEMDGAAVTEEHLAEVTEETVMDLVEGREGRLERLDCGWIDGRDALILDLDSGVSWANLDLDTPGEVLA